MEPPSHPGGLGEFELIDRFFVRAAPASRSRRGVRLGIGDDAAVLRPPPGSDVVAAVDTLVAGRHFPEHSPPHSIGHRALAVNLSDMAAMGATPAWAMLAMTLPAADADWLERFAAGFMALADTHDVALVGGDTTAGPLTISVSIMGCVPLDGALRRDGACAGDLLAVTGSLGDAGAGLALVTGGMTTPDRAAADYLIRRFEYPTPRVAFGVQARGIASAAMDLSDGLVGDLPKLCAASGLAAQVVVERLPLSNSLGSAVPLDRARELAMAAGDDYELLVAVAPQRLDELTAAAGRLNLTLTVIGDLRPGAGVNWSMDGRPYAPSLRGYDHFR